ncbi:TetR/AcrR family transcriptional regulator [Paenibacillus sp. YIM B09110]|uniref:TetR/AcrR family transcriptional regulator n=1 Tax=Paenibacillus sp. YIM B09110 TaxID=3126102 RepID=UPI00301E46C3
MDRRVLKTRKAIIDALVELLGERDLDQITINDIADRANVNRGTVYLHYTDKYDLLDQCIETYLQQLYESCMPNNGGTLQLTAKESLLLTFQYLEKHAYIYTMLLTRKGIPAFRNRLMTIMAQGIEEQIKIYGIKRGMNRDITVQFLTSAAVGLVEWWIIQSMPYPAEEMVEQLLALLSLHLPLPLPNEAISTG